MRELQGVNNWIPFGLYLGIKIQKLNAIELECPTIEGRRIKMLEQWQNNVIPTWSAVVQALVGIGMRRLASELARKHGEFSPLIFALNCSLHVSLSLMMSLDLHTCYVYA